MRKRIIGVCAIVLVVIASLGCIEKEGQKSFRAEIEKGIDDGSMFILAGLYPDIVAGWVVGNLEGAFVGVVVSGGGDTTIQRALYRFNISSWSKGDITLHLHCTYKVGDPGKVEIYVVNDFRELPEEPSQDPEDISSFWNIVNSGTIIGEVEANQGDWFEIIIPETAIVDTNYLALVLKLKNESVSGGNAYGFSTFEYAERYNEDKPYVEWVN